ncbi:MAG: o-succinylbenzoate--CoA ligase [Ignavibacteria bacterium]|nr:o-succinylbenzoate--CoA ligase [Ignavibacteria bacterium]MBT8383728.1 o-succinylbenzoate--CoA ligase [Ignavibacteria bacterium]MBT8391905.1 o-succinylbenzoate--CoA ligase [Ignavibacteria bacterium]NNJ53313.1 o-succinylbenzoate--CoA ligase [Ignavibacteriaceae bacterium]NNL22251.1 o-succinylbenzoate--CoA ligase [Ignavibacteriaceae bacterium]
MQAPPTNRFVLQNQDLRAKAVITENFNLNFKELTKKVLSSASSLIEEGISKDNCVGIYSPNSPEYLINVLALWQIGAIPVPLNTRLSKEEVQNQIQISGIKSVLVKNDIDFPIDSVTTKKIEFPKSEKNKNEFLQRTEIDLNNGAAIIFTSGSGKFPKGVKLTFNSFYQSGFNSNKLLRYSHSDRWLLSLPLYHIGGFSILTRAILWGIPIVFPKSFSENDLAIEMKNSHPTFISLVAAQLKYLVDKNVAPNHELKNCLLGGGFNDFKLVKKAIELGYPVNVVYGSTETASFITALLTDEFDVKKNSVGRTVPPSNIFINDENGNELKPYEVGNITIGTTALMDGYINEQNEKVKNGLYFSGDIGYLDEEGYLFLIGRKDSIISTGGENVNPLEVETALLEYPEISEAVVFALKDPKWGEIVAASVVLKNKTNQINIKEIQNFLVEKISKYKIPKKIFFEKELPKTELGKVEREKLIKNYML